MDKVKLFLTYLMIKFAPLNPKSNTILKLAILFRVLSFLLAFLSAPVLSGRAPPRVASVCVVLWVLPRAARGRCRSARWPPFFSRSFWISATFGPKPVVSEADSEGKVIGASPPECCSPGAVLLPGASQNAVLPKSVV